jgi:hypothetical protein
MKSALQRLVENAVQGGITLVVGAGVSFSRNLPSWQSLVEETWSAHFGRQKLPWKLSAADEEALEQLAQNGSHAEHLQSLRKRLAAASPLAFQMAFELIEEKLESKFPQRSGLEFAGALRKLLYRDEAAATQNDTLAVLAAVLRQEQARDASRIQRVITFNVDDLLEREVQGEASYRKQPIIWPISRASNHPRRERGAHSRPPIPVYHLHGFLPKKLRAWHLAAPDTLIFTDAQYWASCASPLSFANKIMSHALHDSHCVFIGLSMTDINILRWLGIRFNEICDDKRQQFKQKTAGGGTARNRRVGSAEKEIRAAQRKAIGRHYWIRTEDSADWLFKTFFLRRGVASIIIPTWKPPAFETLMRQCFPPS